MKIFKQPTFKICNCEKCGTVFQPEASDTLEYRFLPPLGETYEVYTRCPTCEWYCEVTPIGERLTEQNACVTCGDVIPEGRQVCPKCEKQ